MLFRSDIVVNDASGQNLVRVDYLKYLAYKLTGTVKGVDLFNNENVILSNLGKSGFELHYENIINVFNNSGTRANPLTDSTASVTNLSRHIINQMMLNPIHRNRFEIGTQLTVNGVNSSNHSFQDTYDDQPVPIIDGDQFIFELTIKSHPNQHLVTNVAPIPDRKYKITIQATSESENLSNIYPPLYAPDGSEILDNIANSYFMTRNINNVNQN